MSNCYLLEGTRNGYAEFQNCNFRSVVPLLNFIKICFNGVKNVISFSCKSIISCLMLFFRAYRYYHIKKFYSNAFH